MILIGSRRGIGVPQKYWRGLQARHSGLGAIGRQSPRAGRYRFQPTPARFRLHDSINSPGFPGSSTYYFNGLGQAVEPASGTQPKSIWTSIAENVKSFTETAVPAYMQYKIFSENLKRSRTGQEALDPNVYAPAVRVRPEIDPALLQTGRNVGIGVAGAAIIGIGLLLLLRKRG